MQEVRFIINPRLTILDCGISDESIADSAEMTKERNGYFETWGYKVIRDDDGHLFQFSVGVVIEQETGQVYEVIPENIIFPANNASLF